MYFNQLKPYVERHLKKCPDDFYITDKYIFKKHSDKSFIWGVKEDGTNIFILGDDNPNLFELHKAEFKAIFHCHNGTIKKLPYAEAIHIMKENL